MRCWLNLKSNKEKATEEAARPLADSIEPNAPEASDEPVAQDAGTPDGTEENIASFETLNECARVDENAQLELDDAPQIAPESTLADEQTEENAEVERVEEATDATEPDEPEASEVENDAASNDKNGALLREILDVASFLRQDFDVKFKYDKKKDEQVDRLYEECKAYRDDVFWALKKDLILDVVREIVDVEKRASFFATREQTPELCEKMLKFVREIAENLRFALEKHDVFSYSSPGGSRFDPARQRALEVKTTNDETLDKTIEPLRQGFDYEGNGKTRNVRKEIVYVYKYEPSTVAEELSAASSEAESPEVENVSIDEAANVETSGETNDE